MPERNRSSVFTPASYRIEPRSLSPLAPPSFFERIPLQHQRMSDLGAQIVCLPYLQRREPHSANRALRLPGNRHAHHTQKYSANAVLTLLDRSCIHMKSCMNGIGVRQHGIYNEPANPEPSTQNLEASTHHPEPRTCLGMPLVYVRQSTLAEYSLISLRVSRPPDPECPKCHCQEIENLYPAVPRWLACPSCGYMWSNRRPYRRASELDSGVASYDHG
jgi:hypothetical protein